MKPEWTFEKDVFAKWVGDDDDFHKNVGPGKYFSMGPTCKVNGEKSHATGTAARMAQ